MVDLTKPAIAFALGAIALALFVPVSAIACDRGAYDGSYFGDSSYRDHRYDDANYYDGYRDRDRYGGYVCDPDGDRCYRSHRRYWDYHEYYRRNGYHWN
ncbi:MAG TPA: hypothetical protein VLT91_11235 [Rhizomicrobium sp.]|nr:hypothetical protein [Rhizomicrobium sp.]